MELKKKSFILHVDSLDILSDLSDEQAGKLFKAMLAFHKGEELELDALTKMAFSFFKNQFIRDNEKYTKTCEARAQAGSKGGKQKQQNIANASKIHQKVAKVADSDSDSEKDSDSKKEKGRLDFSPLAFSDEEIKEFKTLRAKKKAAITQRVISDHAKQFDLSRKRGYTNDDILSEWSNRGWTAYKDEWMRAPLTKPIMPQQKQQTTFDALSELEKL